MPVNSDKPHRWKADIAKSVDMYNDWFMRFAPKAFRETRVQTTVDVVNALKITGHLQNIDSAILIAHPEILPTLRMSTCPPLAVDRLIGLAGVSTSLVKRMENKGKLPVRLQGTALDTELMKISRIVKLMADPDIFLWLNRDRPPTKVEVLRAATIVADRLCGAVANPIIRNAQEKRQLAAIKNWLEAKGYRQLAARDGIKFDSMPRGSYSFHTNIPVTSGTGHHVNIPVDIAVMPKASKTKALPIFLEAKSAGDFTNVNKRRKEEAAKVVQLRQTFGDGVQFNLFLCGYFDTGYLGYEAAEGIDWVWEHRIDDLTQFGL